MKSKLSFLLALVLAFTLVFSACDNKKQEKTETDVYSELPGYFTYDERLIQAVGPHGRRLKIGDELDMQLLRVDLTRRFLDFRPTKFYTGELAGKEIKPTSRHRAEHSLKKKKKVKRGKKQQPKKKRSKPRRGGIKKFKRQR